jgi:hypothetical protein
VKRLRRWWYGRGLDGDALLAAAARADGHHVARIARERLLARGALDELGALALDRPELAGWCVRNDVVPADDGTAAALFLLTGQLDRYRAVDPDAALLAGALAAAGAERRGRLLAALAAAGDLDPVVVAARAASGRIVWDLPLAEAVAAVAGFGSWRPADADLFDLFAAADPGAVARAAGALPGVLSVDVPGQLVDVALSADATRVAAAYATDPTGRALHRLLDAPLGGGERHTYDLDLTGGTLPGRLAIGNARRLLVHLGGAVIAADRRGLARFAGGVRRDLYPRREFHTVTRLGGGWVALAADGLLAGGTADRVLWQSGAAGPGPDRLAASPDGRHIAVASPAALVLLDDRGRRPAVVPWPRELAGIAFTGAGRLVTLDRAGAEGRLTRWRIDGGEPAEEAAAVVPAARNLDALDGRVLVMDAGGELLQLRDAATFAVRRPLGVESARIPYPRSAAGRVAVNRHWLRPEHAIDVYPPAAYGLVARPLSRLTPGDLLTVERQLEDERTPATRALLELLRDGLRIRFRAEVALGRGDRLAPDDIALGAGPCITA